MNKNKSKNKTNNDIDLFLGKNSKNIKNKRPNIFAALLGPIYYAYRKCYLLAFITSLTECIFIYIISLFFSISVYIYISIFALLHLIFGNYFCLVFIQKKVKILRKKYRKDADTIISKEGGTNIYAAIGTIIIFIFMSVGIYLLQNIGSPITGKKYKINKLTFNAKNWKKKEGSNELNFEDSSAKCTLTYGILEPKYANIFYMLYDIEGDYTSLPTEKINGKTWYKKEYDIATIIKGEVYLYKKGSDIYTVYYQAEKANHYEVCKKEFKKIKKTIKVNK